MCSPSLLGLRLCPRYRPPGGSVLSGGHDAVVGLISADIALRLPELAVTGQLVEIDAVEHGTKNRLLQVRIVLESRADQAFGRAPPFDNKHQTISQRKQ